MKSETSQQSDPESQVFISLPLPDGWLHPDPGKVVRRLQHCDYEAYLVGGCVRDLLVGRFPKDFDIATSARPNEVKRAFSNCRLIGRRFRLAHILFRDNIIEVATFRRDPSLPAEPEEEASLSEAEVALQRRAASLAEAPAELSEEPVEGDEDDGEDDQLIRSDNVFGNPIDDAFRRDFTINALYYDTKSGQVIDYVGGMQDIEASL